MGYCRQEYWSGLPFPSEHLPNPGIKPESLVSPALQTDSLPLSLRISPHGYMLSLFSCPVVSDSLPPHDCSTPGFPVPHHLLEFAHFHVHWVGDAVQPSHPLTPSSPSALNLSQYQGLCQWVICLHQMTKMLELSFSICPCSEYSGLISLKID